MIAVERGEGSMDGFAPRGALGIALAATLLVGAAIGCRSAPPQLPPGRPGGAGLRRGAPGRLAGGRKN